MQEQGRFPYPVRVCVCARAHACVHTSNLPPLQLLVLMDYVRELHLL